MTARMTTRMTATTGLLAFAALIACKGARHDGPATSEHAGSSATASAPVDAAAPIDANLDGCRAALPRIAALPPVERPQALLDACQPCGDWSPLLAWNTMVADGGPSHAAIEAAMVACHGYCDGNAKQRFLGLLDASRGQSTRGPWRQLGDACKAQVSSEPDARYMSAPFFALDRIARALGDAGPAISVPLPAVSVTGVGVELPEAPKLAAGIAIDGNAGTLVLTIDARDVLVGQLPGAALSSHGLAVTGDYPGKVVALDKLVALYTAHITPPALIIAPHALPAARVAEVIAALHGAQVRLAVAAPSPHGWSLPAALPVDLIVAPAHATSRDGAIAIALAAHATVDDLVAQLAAAIAPGVATIAITR